MISELETFLIENLQVIFDSMGWFGVVALLSTRAKVLRYF